MNIDFSNLDFTALKKASKISLRIIILIAIILYYLNFRNNQCIKNQNCQPWFLTYEIKPFQQLKYTNLLYYKIDNNTKNIDFFLDSEFDKKNNNKNFLSNNKDEKQKIINLMKNSGPVIVYNYLEPINTNIMMIKKFKMVNKSQDYIKIKATVKTEPTINSNLKIYNCFCDSNIELQPFETKELYIYLSVNDNSKNNYFSIINIAINNK